MFALFGLTLQNTLCIVLTQLKFSLGSHVRAYPYFRKITSDGPSNSCMISPLVREIQAPASGLSHVRVEKKRGIPIPNTKRNTYRQLIKIKPIKHCQ